MKTIQFPEPFMLPAWLQILIFIVLAVLAAGLSVREAFFHTRRTEVFRSQEPIVRLLHDHADSDRAAVSGDYTRCI